MILLVCPIWRNNDNLGRFENNVIKTMEIIFVAIEGKEKNKVIEKERMKNNN